MKATFTVSVRQARLRALMSKSEIANERGVWIKDIPSCLLTDEGIRPLPMETGTKPCIRPAGSQSFQGKLLQVCVKDKKQKAKKHATLLS